METAIENRTIKVNMTSTALFISFLQKESGVILRANIYAELVTIDIKCGV